jgi:hypothetical protein
LIKHLKKNLALVNVGIARKTHGKKERKLCDLSAFVNGLNEVANIH